MSFWASSFAPLQWVRLRVFDFFWLGEGVPNAVVKCCQPIDHDLTTITTTSTTTGSYPLWGLAVPALGDAFDSGYGMPPPRLGFLCVCSHRNPPLSSSFYPTRTWVPGDGWNPDRLCRLDHGAVLVVERLGQGQGAPCLFLAGVACRLLFEPRVLL